MTFDEALWWFGIFLVVVVGFGFFFFPHLDGRKIDFHRIPAGWIALYMELSRDTVGVALGTRVPHSSCA